MGNSPALPVLSDAQLMQSIVDGDREAVRVLYDRYSRLVYSQALKICADVCLAEDAVQDVFVAVWRDPGRFDTRRRFTTWLLTITHHKAVDRLRREVTARQRAVPASDEDIRRGTPAGPPAEDAALNAVDQAHVRAALGKLPADQRTALALAYYGGYTQREVATITGVPIGTVKSRMFAGTQLLRRLLTPLNPQTIREPAVGGVTTFA